MKLKTIFGSLSAFVAALSVAAVIAVVWFGYLPLRAEIKVFESEVAELQEIIALSELIAELTRTTVADRQIVVDVIDEQFIALAAAAPEYLVMIDTARAAWDTANRAQVSVQASEPGAPVDRTAWRMWTLNMGLLDQILADLGRIHQSEAAEAATEARKGLDLILGFLVAAASVATAAVTAAAIGLGGLVLRPVQSLVRGVRKMTGESVSVRVTPSGAAELVELAQGFNAMADEIEARQSRLEEMSLLDPLTGVANRRGLERSLAQEDSRVRRYSRPYSLLMIDLDHFKKVNDTHGHLAGDRVLAAIGDLLQDLCRATDTAGRYGGEEFAVVLPETPAESALVIAERIRERLAETPVTSPDGKQISVTASIGIASVPDNGADAAAALAEADRALYKAKNGGRNQVAVAT